MGAHYEFESELWRWEAREQLWVFASVPEEISAEIRDQPRAPSGFNSVRVRVHLGGSHWSTSIFPPTSDGPYSLPIKKSVRTAEGIGLGDTVTIGIDVD